MEYPDAHHAFDNPGAPTPKINEHPDPAELRVRGRERQGGRCDNTRQYQFFVLVAAEHRSATTQMLTAKRLRTWRRFSGRCLA